MIKVVIGSQYHRTQFDDWLAGGKIEYKGEKYHWSAQDSNYGFGWEIEPIDEEDWSNLDEEEFNRIIKVIAKCINEHESEYIVGYP